MQDSTVLWKTILLILFDACIVLCETIHCILPALTPGPTHPSLMHRSISDTTTKCVGALHLTEAWQYSASNVTMPSNMWKELSHILINLLPSLCACTFHQETVRWISWACSKKVIRSNEIASLLILYRHSDIIPFSSRFDTKCFEHC